MPDCFEVHHSFYLNLSDAYYSESEDEDEDKDSSSGGKTSPGSSRSLSGQSSSTTISSSVEDIADVDTSTVPRRDKSLMKSTFLHACRFMLSSC